MTDPPVDLLILGAGWTSVFLIPTLDSQNLTYAYTTRSEDKGSIQWIFDPNPDSTTEFTILPDAKTVFITFPIIVPGASERLVKGYQATRSRPGSITNFIQLGSTAIWKAPNPSFTWYTRHSPLSTPLTPRALEESNFLSLTSPTNPSIHTTVLNLAGLWGGTRIPRNWLPRIAPTKSALKDKGSLHLIHGEDLARAVIAVSQNFDTAKGERWLITDGRVYDWWDLASAWGSEEKVWVKELMREEGVRALPREVERLGRGMDSREFWEEFRLLPERTLWS